MPPGTLSVLVLRVLRGRGCAIAQRIRATSTREAPRQPRRETAEFERAPAAIQAILRTA